MITNKCGCSADSPCPPTLDCACKVSLSTDCITLSEDLTCSNILKGQTETEVLKQLDAYICERFNSVTNFLQIINVGAGSKIYKGATPLGKKQLRSLLGSGLVTLTENLEDITLTINEVLLKTFVQTNQKTYSAANIGQGIGIYKDRVILGDNAQLNFKKIRSSNATVVITEGVDDIDFTVVPKALPDGSETKITQGSNVTITGAGTTASPYVVNSSYVDTVTTVDGSETKVTSGTNTTITGSGTTATPYIVNSMYAPFEAINEANGIGYILRGRNPLFYGPIGYLALDMSYSDAPSVLYGATGIGAVAFGDYIKSSGYGSISFGNIVDNSAVGGFVSAYNSKNSGYLNSVFGVGHDVTSIATTVLGQASTVINEQILDMNASPLKPLLVVGNGVITNNNSSYPVVSRSNAFWVDYTGRVIAPSLTTTLIANEVTGKVLVTKEYLEQTTTNLQRTVSASFPLTNADNNYTIIVVSGATPINITVPAGLSSKFNAGFIQQGTGDVAFVPATTVINTPVGSRIKGQNYCVFIEQVEASNVFQLSGNTKI